MHTRPKRWIILCAPFACSKLDRLLQYLELSPEKKQLEPPDAEIKAALNEVNAKADEVIDVLAHFLAFPESAKYGYTHVQAEDALKDLYKYRHHESLDGLQELINSYSPG
jgi:hypothetical protein